MTILPREAASASITEVLARLDVGDVEKGLDGLSVLSRRGIHGSNELEDADKTPLYMKFIDQFKDPLIGLLGASALISLLVGQYDDALSILAAVIIVATVAFIQEYRSEKSLEALSNLVPPHANLRRDGAIIDVEARDIVIGDIVILSSGDRVPADCRLINANELVLDESSLTGEDMPCHKTDRPMQFSSLEDIPLAEFRNLVFMGTLVCAGRGVAIVIGTGMNTEFGKTFGEMRNLGERRTPLQDKMDMLGKHLTTGSFVIIGVLSLIGLLQGKSLLSVFTIGVSLAVAAIPEGLPICVTVTLALGVMRMANRHAIVKKLPAVEALGCATVACVDKTGTLTKNEMTIKKIYCVAEDEVIEVTGVGYSTEGSLQTQDGHVVPPGGKVSVDILLEVGCLCNNASIEAGNLHGQPTEIALLVAAEKAKVEDLRGRYERIGEVPFSSERKKMEVLYRIEGAEIYYVKGTVETILDKCTHTSSKGESIQLTSHQKEKTRRMAEEFGRQGLRVMAMAYGPQIDALTFAGIVGMMDPPRPKVNDAISRLQSSMVRMSMITGDAKDTAVSISKSLGFYDDGRHRSLSGQEIDALGSEELSEIIKSTTVFYRTTPRHKLLIVQALQKCGEVVAMTGDGVNDAPALKAADIGVAMGSSGTDVAKEAADMVIINDDFFTIISAIEEGKAIYYNIRNFITFQLSTSVAALGLVAVSNILDLPSPLNPMQILWINIIMDGPPAQSLGVEPVCRTVTQRPPRDPSEHIIDQHLLFRVLSSGLMIMICTLWVYVRHLEGDEATARDTTLTFTTFIFFDMFNALSCRSADQYFFKLKLTSNMAFCIAVGLSVLGQLLVIYCPPLQAVFQTEALSFLDMCKVVAVSSSILVLDTLRKYIRKVRLMETIMEAIRPRFLPVPVALPKRKGVSEMV